MILDMAWRACTVPLYDLSWVSRQHDVGIWCEGPVAYLYMISAESPDSMTFGSCVGVLYCTFIWSQLSLQAAWYLDLVWGSCTVPVYDISWVSRQHGIWLWREWRALYLYLISAEYPFSMTFAYSVMDVHCTCIWSQLSLQAAWRLDMAWGACTVPVYDLSWVSKQHDVGIWRESYSGGEGPFKDKARLIRPPGAVQQATVQVTAER